MGRVRLKALAEREGLKPDSEKRNDFRYITGVAIAVCNSVCNSETA